MKQINNYIMRNSFFGKGALNRISAFSRLLALCALICVGNVAWGALTISDQNNATCGAVTSCGANYYFTIQSSQYSDGSFAVKDNGSYTDYTAGSGITKLNWGHVQYQISMNLTGYILINNGTITFQTTPPTCGPALTASSISDFSSCRDVVSDAEEVTLSGASGFTAGDVITITAPTGFKVSRDNSTFQDAIHIIATAANALSQNTFYVKMDALTSDPSNGNITFSNSGSAFGTAPTVAVSGVVNQPNLTPSISSLSAFESCPSVPSDPTTFTISGSCFSTSGQNVTVSATTGFEVSLDGSSWATSQIISATGSTFANSTIYVRMNSASTPDDGNVTFTSENMTTKTVAVSGSVTTPALANVVVPTLADLANDGEDGTPVSFTVDYTCLPAGSTLTVSSSDGANVSLSTASGGTFGSSVSFDNLSGTGSVTVYAKAEGKTIAGTYSSTITATAGGLSESTDVSYGVSAPQITGVATYDCSASPAVYIPDGKSHSDKVGEFSLASLANVSANNPLTISFPAGSGFRINGAESVTLTSNDYFEADITYVGATSPASATLTLSAYDNGITGTPCTYSVALPSISDYNCPTKAYRSGVSEPFSFTPSFINDGSTYLVVRTTDDEFRLSSSATGDFTENQLSSATSPIHIKYIGTSTTIKKADLIFYVSKDGVLTEIARCSDIKGAASSVSVSCMSDSLLINGYTKKDLDRINESIYWSPDSLYGYFDINIVDNSSNPSVINTSGGDVNATSNCSNVKLAFGGAQLNFEGLNVTRQMVLPNMIYGFVGICYTTTFRRPQVDGDCYECSHNSGNDEVSEGANLMDLAHYKYAMCGSTNDERTATSNSLSKDYNNPTVGYFMIDLWKDNGSNGDAWDNKQFYINNGELTKGSNNQGNNRFYFYVEDTVVYYSLVGMPEVALNDNGGGTKSGERYSDLTGLSLNASSIMSGKSYQWYKDGVLLEGETGASVNVNTYGYGSYTCKVTGKITSNSSATECERNVYNYVRTSPAYVIQPADGATIEPMAEEKNYCPGDEVTLSARVEQVFNESDVEVTYQWWKDDEALTDPAASGTIANSDQISPTNKRTISYSFTADDDSEGKYVLKITVNSSVTVSDTIKLTENETHLMPNTSALAFSCSGSGEVTFAQSCVEGATLSVAATSAGAEASDLVLSPNAISSLRSSSKSFEVSFANGKSKPNGTYTYTITATDVNDPDNTATIDVTVTVDNAFTITPSQLAFNETETEITVSIAPADGACMDVVNLALTGTEASYFSIKGGATSVDLSTGAKTITLVLNDPDNIPDAGVYDAQLVATDTREGNFAPSQTVDMSATGCTQETVLSLDFGTNSDGRELNGTEDDYISNIRSYNKTLNWVTGTNYSITTLKGPDGNVAKASSSNTNNILAFTMFNDPSEGNGYRTFFDLKADALDDETSYLVSIKYKHISKNTDGGRIRISYTDGGTIISDITGLSRASDNWDPNSPSSWNVATFVVSGADLGSSKGVRVAGYRTGNQHAYAFDDITIKSLCPIGASWALESGSYCAIGSVNAVLTASNVSGGSGSYTYAWYYGTYNSGSPATNRVGTDETLDLSSSAVTSAGYTGGTSQGEFTLVVRDASGLVSEKVVPVNLICSPIVASLEPSASVVCAGDVEDITVTYRNYNGYTIKGFRVKNSSDEVVRDSSLAEENWISAEGAGTFNLENVPLASYGDYTVEVKYDNNEIGEVSATFNASEALLCADDAAVVIADDVEICAETKNTNVSVENFHTSATDKSYDLVITTDAAGLSPVPASYFSNLTGKTAGEASTITVRAAAAPETTGEANTYYIHAVAADGSKTGTTSFTVRKVAITTNNSMATITLTSAEFTKCQDASVRVQVSGLTAGNTYYYRLGSNTYKSVTGVTSIDEYENFGQLTEDTIVPFTIEDRQNCVKKEASVTLTPEPCEYDLGNTGLCDGKVTITATAKEGDDLTASNFKWYETDASGDKTGYESTLKTGKTIDIEYNAETPGNHYWTLFVTNNSGTQVYSQTFAVNPRTDCVMEYFVRNTVTSSGDGSTWKNNGGGDGALKTLQEALDNAAALHADPATADKKVAIYVASYSNSGDYTYLVSSNNTLNNVSIYGGYPHTTGASKEGANGYTNVVSSVKSNSTFKVADGENVLSHLEFANSSNARVIISDGTNKEESLVLDSCKFTGNNAGCVKLNSSNGGDFKVIDSEFSGNGTSGSTEGVAIKVEGPYDVIITASNLDDLTTIDDETTIDDGCATDKIITLELLDPDKEGYAKSKFINNGYADHAATSGLVIRVENARSFTLEGTLIADNQTKGGNGCGLYLNNINTVTLYKDYVNRNRLNAQSGMLGAGAYMNKCANTAIDFCRFDGNQVANGNGGAISSSDSKTLVSNTSISANIISASGFGAGFYALNSSLLNFKKCKFYDNEMTTGAGTGGGAYVKGAVVNLIDCVFDSNFSGQAGSGFYIEGDNSSDYDANTIVSADGCYFYKNNVKNGIGSGVFYAKNSKVDIKQSFFSKNKCREQTAGTVHILNGTLNLFSTSFYDNRPNMTDKGYGAVSVINNPLGSDNINAYIYNCTMSKDGGIGEIFINNAYAEIVSCTMVGNTGKTYAENDFTDGSTNSAGKCKMIALQSSGKYNLYNTIISGNSSNSYDNPLVFKRNTIGTTIYGDSKSETVSSSITYRNCIVDADDCEGTSTCTPSFSANTNLKSLCNYGAPIASTQPFVDNSVCAAYGMTIEELQNLHPSDAILTEELTHDEHLNTRGYMNICKDCGENLSLIEQNKSSYRTYQGAVEGGKDIRLFSINLTRMVGLCSGGELSDPYIDIELENQDGEVLTGLDSYSLKVDKLDNEGNVSSTIYTQNPVRYNIENAIRVEKPASGTYRVTVCRYSTTARTDTAEIETASIVVESLGSTALAWTGAEDGDYNNIGNWVYLNDDGTYGDVPSEAVLPQPSACYDVHIGLDNPIATGNVRVLPTILENSYPHVEPTKQYGECADIYFHPGGSLGQIHKLSYKKAHVEMELASYNRTKAAWSLLAPPLKEVYSGDYYNDNFSSYMRYVTMTNSGNEYTASWSKSMNALNVPLSDRMLGFAFYYYVKRSGYMDSVHTYKFPTDETLQLTYYNAITGAPTGKSDIIEKSDKRFRFILEDDDDNFIDDYTQTIDLTNRGGVDLTESAEYTDLIKGEGAASGYVAITNPYMSHLDLEKFYDDNSEAISKDIKLFVKANQSFVSFDADAVSGSDMTQYIAPMQSFWVKPLKNAATLNLRFNAANISVVAPTNDPKNRLRGAYAKTNTLTINAYKDDVESPTASVVAARFADAKYVNEEDVQKLLSSTAVVDVYTVTSDIPTEKSVLDIDSLTDVSLPVTLFIAEAGNVRVAVKGFESFDDVDDIYWVDNNTGKKTSIQEKQLFDYTDIAKGKTEGRFSILFKQKKRVKVEVQDVVCQGDAYSYAGGKVATSEAGTISQTIRKFNDNDARPDTAYYVSLKVNPTYNVVVKDTINEGESYSSNGFDIKDAKAGLITESLSLTTVNGCDSTVTLKLTVNPTLYKALVYNGTDEPVEKWVTEDGTGLGLTGNALAYFEDVVPDALCSMTNVICKNGGSYSASKISLTADADFYAPYTFTADEIEFSHKPVAASEANGWQTIVLPFTATDFRNSGSADGMAASRLTPFNESDARKNGDFWLKPFSSSTINGIGFGYPQASELKANTPYIVAYPGSSYGSKYSLEGQTITYSASSAVVEKTPSPIIKELGDYSVIGVTAATGVKDAYMLDVEKNSFCLAESSTAAPFTCYVLSEGGARTRSLTIYDDDDDDDRILTDTDGLTADGPALFAVIVKEKMAYIYASKAGKADVTDMTGRKVLRSVDYGRGMTAVGTLPAGAYIIGGVKTVIK